MSEVVELEKISVHKLAKARKRTFTRKHRIVACVDDKNRLLNGSKNAVFRVLRCAPRDNGFCLSLEPIIFGGEPLCRKLLTATPKE